MVRFNKILGFVVIVMFVLIGNIIDAAAQERNCVVTGRVVDSEHKAVEFAAVAVTDSTGKVVSGALSDADGRFVCKVAQSSIPYTLTIELLGFAKFRSSLNATKQKVELGIVVLEESPTMLKEAVVTAEEVDKRATVEHTTIKTSATAAATGNVSDILRNASSVTFEGDGSISIRGNRNVLILLDGVPTTVSDLNAIPSSSVKSIDIVTNPDASYDAEGTGGIINIVSTKERAAGLSGAFSANYGFNHFANVSAALAYNTAKASYRFNYSGKYEDDIVKGTLDRVVDSSSTHQQFRSNRYTFNNNIGLGADFRIDKRNTLNVDLKCIIPRLNIRQELENSIIRNGVQTDESRNSDISWNRENIDASVGYSHVMKPEVSDFSLRASLSKIWGHRPSYYYLEGSPVGKSNSGGSPLIASLQGDFHHKIKAGRFAYGAKMTYRRNDIYHQFYSMVSGDWQYSGQLSNDLVHQEYIPALYVMFTSKPIGPFSYKAGLRGEGSVVLLHSEREKVDTATYDFFLAPTFSATYDITQRQRLSLAFSRRVGRPTYPQLNPYMSMVDANTFEQGNMRLKPEKTSKLDLSYSLNSKYVNLFADLYLSYSRNYISQITSISGSRLVTTYINGSSDMKTGCDVTLKVRPAKWMTASLSSNTYFVETKGTYGQVRVDNRGWTNNSNILLDFMPIKGMDIQLQYFLTTPQYFPQLTTSLTHYMNIGIRQTFLKGALTASLLLTDVLNIYKWEVHTEGGVFDLTNSSIHKSRMLWVGLSYNFNSFKQKKGEVKSETDRSVIRLGL